MTDSYIDPDRQAWEIFKSLPRDQPIHMLNLIRLREAAAYPQGHPNHGQPITGLQAYREYGRTIAPHLARLGSRQVWAGSPQVMVTGPRTEAWDLAFIVEYPGSQAFIDMVRDPDYRENVVPHRTAAVADSRLLRLAPLDPDDKLGH
ncbi:MAG TPA: DUF1330 domain-containing protein [Phenylobacterium sp.]|jgi:uncharacterized protein (DUF1330 family)|uniref:DUF1330 domain-containing protein n=1 Tax=Phenylobacterium sp. TaxID=1871053 RepID=UPI002D2B7778|nr:DUF1330 domain-containing protein [Phenylobacterium sp.]HZZ70270.1 DUF1330 domain-containing protein [Phenylobacterium sp.]